jgi:hypothetical protein
MPVKIDHGGIEAARHSLKRSSEWPRVEKEHLKRQPHCVACKPGTNPGAGLQVHHIFPFHYCVALGRPDLELGDRNLITLCEDEAGKPGQNHHLLIGHLDDFKSPNVRVSQDAAETFFGMTAADIKADHRWLLEKASRLKPLDQMTDEDKKDFTQAMNAAFPKLESPVPEA